MRRSDGKLPEQGLFETSVSQGRRDTLAALAGLFALGMTGKASAASTYPDRPLNLIVPFAPGGPVDIAGRALGEPLGASLGQAVIVQNKAGAGGNIGAASVARSRPDGYELLLALDSIMTVNPFFYQDAAFSSGGLEPIGMVGELSSVLVVNSDSPIKKVADFVEHARSDTLMSGSGGNGTAGHLYAEWLKRDFGLKLEHVPYKGLAPAVKDLLAGNIDCIVALIPGVLPHIRAGSLRALGLTSPRPQVLLPEVQSLSSQGLQGFEGASWLALMVPKGVDHSAMSSLSDALSAALHEPQTRKRLENVGIDPFFMDASQIRDRISRESEQWQVLLAQIKKNNS